MQGDHGGGHQQAPPPPPPPPRKPSKPKPLPKLSQDALKGKAPLHSFGELEAFFKAKDAPPPVETPVVADTVIVPPSEPTAPPVNEAKSAPETPQSDPSEGVATG
jgi:hypothetical protein